MTPILQIRTTGLGSGVFAGEIIRSGTTILHFSGPLVRGNEIPPLVQPEDDRYIQIGPDLYLGPSGKADDLVNHSCEPNAGVIITDQSVVLSAIRDIAEGEELTWDYSTTMFEDDWTMTCHCNAPKCRGVVGEFILLPHEIRERYLSLGVVPSYNRDLD